MYRSKRAKIIRDQVLDSQRAASADSCSTNLPTNRSILMRVGKSWRQYKNHLKTMKFHPTVKTKEQICNDVPVGQDRSSWINLVKYWYSEESKKSSQNAKEARASQTHVHTTGYADKRADFVVLEGRQPSHLEFFTLTHIKVDGGFVDNTLSSQFLVEASTKVQELVSNASSSKSQIEIENDVFDSLMYEEGQPKRPLGFGLGVKESDIFGVNGNLLKNK